MKSTRQTLPLSDEVWAAVRALVDRPFTGQIILHKNGDRLKLEVRMTGPPQDVAQRLLEGIR